MRIRAKSKYAYRLYFSLGDRAVDSSSSRQIIVIQWFNPCLVSINVTSAFSPPYTCNATRDPINSLNVIELSRIHIGVLTVGRMGPYAKT